MTTSTADQDQQGEPSHHGHDGVDDHDRGLSFDLSTLLVQRRRALTLLAGAGVAALVGCGSSSDGSSSGSGTTAAAGGSSSPPGGDASTGSGSGTSSDDGSIPEETAGPYPGDGSNGPDVLTESGIVRSDIRSSFGSASGVAEGVPLTVTLTVTDAASGAAMPGAAVYLWHCDREGRYSLYSDGVTDQNYLRGVQEADGSGQVTFVSIFPACYSGRWPHIHFEVYPSLGEATSAGTQLVTSQLAFPADVCEDAYATGGYDQSVDNLAQVSLDSDMVFSDGYDQQLATVTGSAGGGYTATLTVPV